LSGGLAGLVLAAGVVTGSLWHGLPARFAGPGSFGWPALEAGRWWTLASSLLLTRDTFMAVSMTAAVAVGLGLYERRVGPGRALAVALVGHVTGSVVVALGAGALGRTGWPVAERAAANLDYGASMVVAAALGAMASRSRNRVLLRLALVGPPLLLLAHHQLADWAHIVACPAGYLVDGARRPRPAAVAALVTAAVTAWLVLYGPWAVVTTTDEIRFAHGPAGGRLERLAYTARALGDRPEVATLYVPAQLEPAARAGGRIPVVVFLHGIPGAPDDWLAGGDLARKLDEEIAAGHFPAALAVVPESATMHDPKAGWVDAPHQPVLRSLRTDLLRALSRRFPAADLGTGHVAVVGVGRGADGAVRLAALDRRFGFTVALRSARGNHWARWRSELPEALQMLTAAGFGAAPPQ
jgi:hypothetical protein